MPTISLPRQLARTKLFTLGAPNHFTIAEDEMTVLFLRSRAADDPAGCLWSVQAGSGTERLRRNSTVISSSAIVKWSGAPRVNSLVRASWRGSEIVGMPDTLPRCPGKLQRVFPGASLLW